MIASLIPQEVFQGIPAGYEWVLVTIAAAAIALLVFGADRAVSGAVRLSAAMGMSKVIIGATVVSLGTTMPEACTSVTAAFAGKPGLALGNGVGSIICDTGLIFGLGLVLTRLPLDRFVLLRHGTLKILAGTLLTATVLALALLHGGWSGVTIPREVGFAFVALLVGYLYISVRWARAHPQIVPDEARAAESAVKAAPVAKLAVVSLLWVVFGMALVVIGSSGLVGSASELARRLDVPPDVVAVTMVAFGTSLPELVTALTAVMKGHGEIMIGNVIGADILNVLFVIGASASAVRLRVDMLFYQLHLPAMMLVLALMASYIFCTRDGTFRRWQGVPLLAAYAGYIALVVAVGAHH